MAAGAKDAARVTVSDCVSHLTTARKLHEGTRERMRKMRELLDEQAAADEALASSLTALETCIVHADRQRADDEKAWALDLEETVRQRDEVWLSRMAALEKQLESERTQHENDVTQLQKDWHDAVLTIRKLEASLDEQQTAASVVLQHSAEQGLLRGAAAAGTAGSTVGAIASRRVASIAHHRAAHQMSQSRQSSGAAAGDVSSAINTSRSGSAASAAAAGNGGAEEHGGIAAGRQRMADLERESFEARRALHQERERRHLLAAEVERLRAAQEHAAASRSADQSHDHQRLAPTPAAAAGPSGSGDVDEGTPPPPQAAATLRPGEASGLVDAYADDEVPLEMTEGQTPLPAARAPEPTRDGVDRDAARPDQPPRPRPLGSARREPLGPPSLRDDDGNVSADPSSIAGDSRPATAPATPERQQRNMKAALSSRHQVQDSTALTDDGLSVQYERRVGAEPAVPRVAGGSEQQLTLGLVLGLRRQASGLLGIEVIRVKHGSPAEAAGITARSLLIELGGRKLRSSDDLAAVLHAIKASETKRVRQGDGRASEIAIPFQTINLDDVGFDGEAVSRGGSLSVNVSNLAVGPFNQRHATYTATTAEFAPIDEIGEDAQD